MNMTRGLLTFLFRRGDLLNEALVNVLVVEYTPFFL